MMNHMKDEHAFAKVAYFYHRKDADVFFQCLQDFRRRLLALQPSEVLNLNLNYQDLLSQHLKALHPTLDPSHVPDMRDHLRVEIEPSQFNAEYPEQLVEKGYGAYPYFLWKEYGITQLYYLFLWAWRDHGPQSLDRWIKRCWIRCTPTTGLLLSSKRPNPVPSACKRWCGRKLLCVAMCSTCIV
ncbi:hypothetical protein NPIL_70401 [Nephila pilipes]|uniref:Uncharacterized protein n=1 Tax=Nephila pilipes TaxID=299642 RepID=A0A8X6PRL2_NEPPI|nr:hypothetical protein NPIL_70401 [Nephila pilipes]